MSEIWTSGPAMSQESDLRRSDQIEDPTTVKRADSDDYSTEPTPPGKFKLVFALMDVSDALSRAIPPSDAWHPAYRDAHSSEIPGLMP